MQPEREKISTPDWIVQTIKNNRKYFVNLLKFAFYSVIIDAVLISLLLSFTYNLLDFQLIVSLVVVEVPIGVFLSILLGEKQNRSVEVVTRLNMMAQFQHLYVYRVSDWNDADYPELIYYVINKKTKQAYYVNDDIRRLVKSGIIGGKKFETKEELLTFFKDNQIELKERYPEIEDIGLGLTPMDGY